jgi:hypothetical protein
MGEVETVSLTEEGRETVSLMGEVETVSLMEEVETVSLTGQEGETAALMPPDF